MILILVMEHLTSSILSMCSRVQEFSQPFHMCFVDLEKAFDRVPRGVLWGVLREYGSGALCSGLSGPCMTGAGAVFALPAVSQTCSQYVLDSARAALCHRFCSLFLWTEFLGAVRGRRVSGLGTIGSHLCCLQTMLS